MKLKLSIFLIIFFPFYLYSLNNSYFKEEDKAFLYKLKGEYVKSFSLFTNLIFHTSKPEYLDFIYLYLLNYLSENSVKKCNMIPFLKKYITLNRYNYLRDNAKYILMLKYLKNSNYTNARKIYKELGFIDKWYIIGPFKNENRVGFNKIFPPEYEIRLNKIYREYSYHKVKFRYIEDNNFTGIDLKNYFTPDENSVAYLLTYIYSPTNQFLNIGMGSDDGLKVWINDKLLISKDIYRNAFFDTERKKVFFKKGINKILVKVTQDKDSWRLLFRITPSNYQIVKYNKKRVKNYSLITQTIVTDFINQVSHISNYRKYFYKGYYYFITENYPDDNDLKEKYFGIAYKLNPKNPYYLFYYAISRDNESDVKKNLLKSITLLNDNIEALSRLGMYYYSLNKYDVALSYFNKIKKEYNISAGYKALIYYKNNLLEEADRIIDKILKVNSSGFLPNFYKAKILWEQDKIKAGNLYYRLFKQDPYDFPIGDNSPLIKFFIIKNKDIEKLYSLKMKYNGTKIEYLNQLSEHFLYNKKLNKALYYINKALKIDPYNIDSLKLNSDIFLALNNKKEAIDSLNKIVEVDPFNKNIRRRLLYLENRDKEIINKYTPDIDSLIEDIFSYDNSYYKNKYSDYAGIMFLDSKVIKFDKQGNKEEIVTHIYYIISDVGKDNFNREVIYFSPQNENVDIIHAETIDRSGKHYDATSIKDYSMVKADEKLYYDYNAKVVKFSHILKDRVILFQYHLLSKNIFQKSYFNDVSYWGNDNPLLLKEYILITPVNQKINFNYKNFSSKPILRIIRLKKNNIYKWSKDNIKIIKKENNMPSLYNIIPLLQISTFKSWEDINQWIYNLYEPALTLNNSMKYIVDYFKKNSKNNMELIEYLYNFVRDKIRYVGLELGVGGIKPRNAIEVFSSRYGDCKDKATLLNSLLKYAKIKSYLALVRTFDKGKSEFKIPMLNSFNHVISVVNINGKYIFLDPTANYFKYNELPYSDKLNKVFLINNKKYKFLSPPPLNFLNNISKESTFIEINSDFSADIERKIIKSGNFAPYIRYLYKNQDSHKKNLESYFNLSYPGTTLLYINYNNINTSYPGYSYKIYMDKFCRKVDDYIEFKPIITPLNLYKDYCTAEIRNFDLMLDFPYLEKNIIKINIPDDYNIKLPSDLIIKSKFFDYSIKFKKISEDNILIYYKFVLKKYLILKNEYINFKNLSKKIYYKEEEYIKLKK